jgi:hypothetical protein
MPRLAFGIARDNIFASKTLPENCPSGASPSGKQKQIEATAELAAATSLAGRYARFLCILNLIKDVLLRSIFHKFRGSRDG